MGIDIERELKIAEMCFDGSMFNGDTKKLEAVGIIDSGIEDRTRSLLSKLKLMGQNTSIDETGMFSSLAAYHRTLYANLKEGTSVNVKESGDELILYIAPGITKIEDRTVTRIFNMALRMKHKLRITGGVDMIYLKNIILSNPKTGIIIDTENTALMIALMFMRCHCDGSIYEIKVHKRNVSLVTAVYCYSRSRKKGDSLITGEYAADMQMLYKEYIGAGVRRDVYNLNTYDVCIEPHVSINSDYTACNNTTGKPMQRHVEIKSDYKKIYSVYRLLEMISYVNISSSDSADLTTYRIMRVLNIIKDLQHYSIFKEMLQKLRDFREKALDGYYETESGRHELNDIAKSITDKHTEDNVYTLMSRIHRERKIR